MKTLKPIQIKAYRPLTETEMKNIFGGSGEGSDSGACGKKNGVACTVTTFDSKGGVKSVTFGACQAFTTTSTSPSGTEVPTSGCFCDTTKEATNGASLMSTEPTTPDNPDPVRKPIDTCA